MQEKIKEMHREITYIQNAIWSIYKDFLTDQNVKAYTQKMSSLTKKYQDKGDSLLKCFAENESVIWSPVINAFAEEFRKSGSDQHGNGDG